jgi:hypothetical protein
MVDLGESDRHLSKYRNLQVFLRIELAQRKRPRLLFVLETLKTGVLQSRGRWAPVFYARSSVVINIAENIVIVGQHRTPGFFLQSF